jgi:hypothetical protein
MRIAGLVSRLARIFPGAACSSCDILVDYDGVQTCSIRDVYRPGDAIMMSWDPRHLGLETSLGTGVQFRDRSVPTLHSGPRRCSLLALLSKGSEDALQTSFAS